LAAREVRRVLIVEDDAILRSAVARTLRSESRVIEQVSTCAAALEALEQRAFDLLLLDVRLPDGSGLQIAEIAAAKIPSPLIVVFSGEASGEEGFKLAQLGVLCFLSKPFSIDDLISAIHLAQVARIKIEPLVRPYVGNADLYAVQENVRHAMVEQALALTNGNRTAAARLLRVTRQAIQKFVRGGT